MSKMNRKKAFSWDLIMVVACVVAALYLLIPLFLRIPLLRDLCAWYLVKLNATEYKSAFAESIGGLLGSFLAIVAALWTQHHFEREAEKKADLENSRVVYYDFKSPFNEIREIIELCAKDARIDRGAICCQSLLNHEIRRYYSGYRVYFDKNWIRNVARLPDYFTADDIDTIYHIYSLFSSLNLVLDGKVLAVDARMTRLSCELYSIIPGTPECKELKDNPEYQMRRKRTRIVFDKLRQFVGVELDQQNP